MGMVTTNPLFLLTKMPTNTRLFIGVSSIACYGLFLYELLPEYLFIPTSSVLYFGGPSIAIISTFVLLPKLFSKWLHGTHTNSSQEESPQPQVETVSFEPEKEQNIILPDNMSAGAMQGTVQGQITAQNDIAIQGVMQSPVVDEVAIQDMVARAMEPVQKESIRMQDTVTDLRAEINTIKSSMETLASTVESSLTDLKSFQAELANPLNFMRKYFDSIDIKSLSDPTLPLHVEQLPLSDPLQVPPVDKDDANPHAFEGKESGPKSKETAQPYTGKEKEMEEMVTNDQNGLLSFKQMLGGKITLGKLMTTISLMEEILQTLGRDSIDVLIDQCKMMGLNQEDEHIVYNVINMMDKSGLSVNDTLIMLYKFGKVMGMNDKESDLIYAKLMMNQGKSQENIMTVEKKVA